MIRRIGPKTTREELANIVTAALRSQKVDAVLVGGSVVAIYSQEEYVTDDLDFVSHKPLKTIAPIMEALGFKMTGNTGVHAKTRLYVQFCSPPLSVGREPILPVELTTKYGKIDTLSPTDCVLDRLMQFFHWNDKQALEQALLVARSRRVQDFCRPTQSGMNCISLGCNNSVRQFAPLFCGCLTVPPPRYSAIMRRYCGVALCAMLSWSNTVHADSVPTSSPERVATQQETARPRYRNGKAKIVTGAIFVAFGLAIAVGCGIGALSFANDAEVFSDAGAVIGWTGYAVGELHIAIGLPMLLVGLEEQQQMRHATKALSFAF